MSRMTSQTVLVTGATTGIGRAAALHLAEQGHRVFATGRKAELLAELESAARQQGWALETLILDVTVPESIAAAKTEVDRRTQGRGIDALVNNAGYGLAGPLELISDADVRAQFDTNVHGLLAVTRAFLPAMRRRREGRIINVSSIGGKVTFPFLGAYNATKYAVESLSDALRVELAPFHVHVSLIEPGLIRTEFNARAQATLAPLAGAPGEYEDVLRTALARLKVAEDRFSAGPETVARAIGKAVSSRRPSPRYVAPGMMWMAVLFLALLPSRWLDAAISRAFGFRRVKLLPASSMPAEVQS
jgi:NAD(P)-dependent dehydrogenase (short-subunit alcohol dehydrogenase family)